MHLERATSGHEGDPSTFSSCLQLKCTLQARLAPPSDRHHKHKQHQLKAFIIANPRGTIGICVCRLSNMMMSLEAMSMTLEGR